MPQTPWRLSSGNVPFCPIFIGTCNRLLLCSLICQVTVCRGWGVCHIRGEKTNANCLEPLFHFFQLFGVDGRWVHMLTMLSVICNYVHSFVCFVLCAPERSHLLPHPGKKGPNRTRAVLGYVRGRILTILTIVF